VAAVLDYSGPALLTRERLRGLQQVAVAHFAERYGLFVLICLGESIVAIGIGAGAHPLTSTSVTAVVFALLATIGFWWVYFDRSAALAEDRLRAHEDPVLAAADGYSYLHLLLVAGIIVFAVGVKDAVANVQHPLPAGARLALYGGAALYLAGQVSFRARVMGSVDYAQLAVAAVMFVLFAVSGEIVAWAAIGILALAFAVLVAWEVLSQRGLDAAGASHDGAGVGKRGDRSRLSRVKAKEI
jgi:low temperature requirement protein LtrA